MNYEESVRWLRAQPEHRQDVTDSYLDADNATAARRFADSEEFAQVAVWLDLHKGRKRILDVGCGNGIASYAMAMLGHEVTALDPDSSDDVGLEAARRLASPVCENGGEIICALGSVESLPFEDATFDVVYTRQAVHHFAELEKGMRECQRVLKPNGIFLATREHVVSDEAQLEQFLKEHKLHHLHGGENAYQLDVYLSALKNAGFADVRAFGPYDSVVNHYPISNSQMREEIAQVYRGKFKIPLAAHLVKIPGVETKSRALLTRHTSHPGRLYSFLCRA